MEDVDRYTLTKNEILTGIYEYKLATGNKNFKLVDFKLVKYDDSIKNAPKGMNFYNVSPNKGNFEALIGVSNDKNRTHAIWFIRLQRFIRKGKTN